MPRGAGLASAALLLAVHAPAAAEWAERNGDRNGSQGEVVRVMRVPGSRGACGRIVHLVHESRIELGAAFRAGGWPDLACASGGDIDALIAIVERALFVSDGRTTFVTERGTTVARSDVHGYFDRLVALRMRVLAAMATNATLCDVLARGIAQDGVLDGHPVPPAFLAAVYTGLSRRVRPGRRIAAAAECGAPAASVGVVVRPDENIAGLAFQISADRIERVEPDALHPARLEQRQVGFGDVDESREILRFDLAQREHHVESNANCHGSYTIWPCSSATRCASMSSRETRNWRPVTSSISASPLLSVSAAGFVPPASNRSGGRRTPARTARNR